MWHRLIMALILFIQFQCTTQTKCKKTMDINTMSSHYEFPYYEKKTIKSLPWNCVLLPFSCPDAWSGEAKITTVAEVCDEACKEDERCEGFIYSSHECLFCGDGGYNGTVFCPIHNFYGVNIFGQKIDDEQLCYTKCHKNRVYANFVPAKTINNGENQWILCNDGYYVADTFGKTGFRGNCENLIYYQYGSPVQCVEFFFCEAEKTEEHNVPRTRYGQATNLTCNEGYIVNSTKLQTVEVKCHSDKEFYMSEAIIDIIKPKCVPNKMPAVCPFFLHWCFYLAICLGFLPYWPN